MRTAIYLLILLIGYGVVGRMDADLEEQTARAIAQLQPMTPAQLDKEFAHAIR